MRLVVSIVLLLVVAPSVSAQISFDKGSFQTDVSAGAPGCGENGGGVLVSPAAVVCAIGGYTAAASGTAGFSPFTDGGEVTVTGETSASSIGSPGTAGSSAVAVNTANASWILSGPTHYSLVVETSGGAFVNFSGLGLTFPPPPSGILTGTSYSLNISVTLSVAADDMNGAENVSAAQSGVARVTFAEVGSTELIMGTVLADGAAMPNLLVEALDGPAVVASTRTGNDGRYLLDGITNSVILRLSAPQGGFASETSPLLTPPATYDADLEPFVLTVPALRAPLLLGLALALVLLGASASSRAVS